MLKKQAFCDYLDAEAAVVSVRVGQGTTWSATPGTARLSPMARTLAPPAATTTYRLTANAFF
jgi:hypothetical protein